MLKGLPDSRVTVIDPCFDCDLEKKFENDKKTSVLKGTSLEKLPNLNDNFDAILIDGDHNYYTVFNELRYVEELDLLAEGGIILLHDICDPYGRKDFFYNSDSIPSEGKQPDRKQGVLTAVEDFMNESKKTYTLIKWTSEHGLGCLFENYGMYSKSLLISQTFFWRLIRWKNRLLRVLGLKEPDTGKWGKV